MTCFSVSQTAGGMIAKISKICDTKQGNNREKALDAALKSYAHYIKKMA